MEKCVIKDRSWLESKVLSYEDGFNIAPFYFLLSKMHSRSYVNSKHEWLVETGFPSDMYRCAEVYNFMQIFIKKVGRTEVVEDQEHLLKKKIIEMAREFESAYLMGRRGRRMNLFHQVRCMGGLSHFATPVREERPFVQAGDVNWHVVAHMFRVPGIKFAFVPLDYMEALTKLRDVPTDQTYGIRIKQAHYTYGTLNVVADPIVSGAIFLVDFDKLVRYYLQERDWKCVFLPPTYTDVGSDITPPLVIKLQYKYELIAEQGLMVGNPADVSILFFKEYFDTFKIDVPKGLPEGMSLKNME